MRVGVFGAGAIGSYLGGRLAAAGTDVVLLGRPRLCEAYARGQLRVLGLDGREHALVPERAPLIVTAELSDLAECDVILVTVKSRDTEAAAQALATALPRPRTIVSFQNGVDNADRLREELSDREVIAGMVSFNVVWEAAATFRQATSGPVAFGRGSAMSDALQAALERSGLDAMRPADMLSIQWSKLLFNLNNAINALSGLPLRDELGQRAYRRVLAAAMDEGRTAARAAGIAIKRIGRMPPGIAPHVLRLPDPVFEILARPMVRIDPQARSSMADDLEKRRPTEIDALNGAVVRLGEKVGVPTPVNAHLVALVHAAEERAEGSPHLAPAALWP